MDRWDFRESQYQKESIFGSKFRKVLLTVCVVDVPFKEESLVAEHFGELKSDRDTEVVVG